MFKKILPVLALAAILVFGHFNAALANYVGVNCATMYHGCVHAADGRTGAGYTATIGACTAAYQQCLSQNPKQKKDATIWPDLTLPDPQ